MPRLHDVLMSLGEHNLTLVTDDPDILDEIQSRRHFLYYQGARLVHCGVILRPPTKRSRTAGGHGLEWWPGVDQEGPLIRDRTYLSGLNKLANPSFALEIPDLYWVFGQDSNWAVVAGRADLAAFVLGLDQDVLASQQEVEVEPGQTYTVAAAASRELVGMGRLRLRPTLLGTFVAQERMVNGDWEDGTTGWGTPFPGAITIVTDAAEARTGTKVLRLGPNDRPNLADLTGDTPNPSFETAPNGANEVADGWYNDDVIDIPANENFTRTAAAARGGSWGLQITPPWEARYEDGTDLLHYNEPISITPGEEYSAGVWVRSLPEAFDGEVFLRGTFNYPSGRPATPAVFWHPVSPTEEDDNIRIGGIGPTGDVWMPCGGTFQAPDGADSILLEVVGRHIDGDNWYIDDLWLFPRNTAWNTVTSDDMAVETGRPYELSMWLRQDADGSGGTIRLYAILSDHDGVVTRPLHLEFIDITDSDDPEEARWFRVNLNFTIPPGYTRCRVGVACRNVDKGSWWVDGMSLKTTDTATWEDISDDLIWSEDAGVVSTLTRALTIPEGAERLRLEWVAEGVGAVADSGGGGGWRVTSTSIIRTDQAPHNVRDVVRDCLKDPDDFSIQLLDEGAIASAGTVRFDVRVRNQTNRELLRRLAQSGLAGDIYEWRVNPDRTFDFDLAENLFVDRDPRIDPATGFVLHGDMFELIEEPDVERDDSQAVTHVRVIGAELTDRLGQKRVLEAEAATGTVGFTLHGDAFRRRLLVQQSELDLPAALAAAAEYHAARQHPAEQVTVRLSDWRHLGRFNVGDWIYIYDPQADLEDAANEMTLDDGTKIWPKKLRVLERDWTHGSEGDGRVEILREDGTTLDISEHVLWEAESSATLVLGDRLPDFTSDPEGGPAGLQLLRLRHALSR